MPTIEDTLTQIQHAIARAERSVPQSQLEELITQMSAQQFVAYKVDIMNLVNNFQKKKKRDLLRVLNAKFSGSATLTDPASEKPRSATPVSTPRRPTITPQLALEFRQALDDLGARHIFQWNTFYRDCLAHYFALFLDELKHASPGDSCRALYEPFASHAQDIFSKGYEYALDKHDYEYEYAIQKSINGLTRFLALPLDYYSARWSSTSDYSSTVALRLLISAAVSGILEGYSTVSFGRKMGKAVLPRFQRSWLHYMAFLTPQDAERVVKYIDAGPLADGLNNSVLPLLDALQRFFEQPDDDSPIPVTGQYAWDQRRLDITVRPPRSAASQRFMEVRAFLEEGFVSLEALEDAVRREVSLVIAPLKPDLRNVINRRLELSAMVVSAEETRPSVANKAYDTWVAAVPAAQSHSERSFAITHNFARDFPLREPNRAKFFHVPRTSVRDLLRTFERRNGVRLWCSVRRSGKTTACFDLESTTGDSMIVSQTCGAEMSSEDETKFHDRVKEAVMSDGMVPRTFIREVISECAPNRLDDKRVVLVIDEYETLFGLLGTAADDERKRYYVVQPILDQLRSFSKDNLLVFLGQRPDAHFVLMDQNQLAPYVEQDPFPLFEHASGTKTGEFADFVHRVLTGRIKLTARFLDALFQETAGHPFLTTNVLVDFVEWWMNAKKPQLGSLVPVDDFAEFLTAQLNVGMSKEYDFFREVAAEALGSRAQKRRPWLHATYWTLRLLSENRGDAFRVGRPDFSMLTSRIPVPDGTPAPDSSEILRTASLSNFLTYDDNWVCVKIRTLGRIAATVRPRIG